VLSLNSYTRWSLGELLDLPVDELVAWQQAAVELYRDK